MPKDLEEAFEVVEALEKVEEAGEDPAGPEVAELIKQYLADQELPCILGKNTIDLFVHVLQYDNFGRYFLMILGYFGMKIYYDF